MGEISVTREYGQDINIYLGSPLYTISFYDGGTELICVGKANNRETIGKVGKNPITEEVQYDSDHTYVTLDGNLWVINNECFVK